MSIFITQTFNLNSTASVWVVTINLWRIFSDKYTATYVSGKVTKATHGALASFQDQFVHSFNCQFWFHLIQLGCLFLSAIIWADGVDK